MRFLLVFYDLSKKAGIQKALIDFAWELDGFGYDVEILLGPNNVNNYFNISEKEIQFINENL